MPNLYLTSHPTPGLADSVRHVFGRSRVVFSRASRMYVLCRGVVCRVSSNGVRSWPQLLVPGMPCGHNIWYMVELSSKLFALSTGILHGAHGVQFTVSK